LEQLAKVRKRDRVLSRAELKAVWPCLPGPHGEVLKWLLWTGCRLNEAAGMRWQEISGNNWTIPDVRTKNGQSRSVPLSRQAIALLAEIKDRNARQPLLHAHLRSAANHPSNGVEGDELVFHGQGSAKLSNWDRYTKKVQKASSTSAWHRHDLRRTVATILGDLGFAPHVVGVVLGHSNIADGATAIYARSRYQREHREALQTLADEIESITNEFTNVVRLAAS
jgi:integrase